MTENRYLFGAKGRHWDDIWARLLGIYLANRIVWFLADNSYHAHIGVPFGFPDLLAFLTILVLLGFQVLALKVNGIEMREHVFVYRLFAGLYKKQVNYKDVASFRFETFGLPNRTFAIIGDRFKLTVPEAMPGFPDFADELYKRHFGNAPPQYYPVWGEGSSEAVKASGPYIPPVGAMIALAVVVIFCVILALLLPTPLEVVGVIAVLAAGLYLFWLQLNPAPPRLVPTQYHVAEW